MQNQHYSYTNPPITASMIRQMEFCPVIPWINYNLGFYEEHTESMTMGKEDTYANYKEEIARKLSLKKPWRFELYIKDQKTGLSGVIDIVAGNRKLTIVEVKRFRRARRNHFRNQLLVYAYLATKAIAPVERAILVMDQEKVLDIEITKEHIEHVENQIKKLRKILETEQPPTPNKTQKQCQPCQYRKICPYAHI